MSKNHTQPQSQTAGSLRSPALTPKLRFLGFDGVWKEKKLGEVSKFFSGGTPTSSSKKYYEGNIPFIKSGEISNSKTEQFITELALKESSAKLVESGDLLYALYGATSGEVAISKISGAINQAVLCIRTEQDKNWLFNYLNFQKGRILAKYLQGGQGNLSADIVKNLKISFPSLPEQQKIASFLGSVDEWVANLRAQHAELASYKKGMMQKIFSQQIRFKDDKGNDFPEWEEKRLGSICLIKKGSQLNRDTLSIDTGHPVINGGVEPSGYTDTWNTEANTITISEGGNSCGYVNLIKESFWCGGHCYSLLNLKDNIHKDFLYQYLKMNQHNIMRLRVGSGLPNIQKKDVEKFKLQIPSLPEQQKIAEFLSSVDQLLESKQQQINQAEQWKKGLMQGLFV